MPVNEIIEHSRSIYTIWDLLGDVGGLFDMLILLAKPILSLYSLLIYSGIDSYLNQSLFKI